MSVILNLLPIVTYCLSFFSDVPMDCRVILCYPQSFYSYRSVLSLIDDAKVGIFQLTTTISDQNNTKKRHLLDTNQAIVFAHSTNFTHFCL